MRFTGTEQQQEEEESNYYSVLGVHPNASPSELRSAYKMLAMKWHPDKLGRREPRIVAEANRRFQLIQEAYQVLSDEKKRMLYDSGLYNNSFEDEEDTEGFTDFLQEMMILMTQEKQYSLEELQGMLADMAKSFEKWDSSSTGWFCSDAPTSTKRSPCDSGTHKSRRRSTACMHLSAGMEFFGSMRFQ